MIRGWRGDKIVAKVEQAAREAIDETTAAAADAAQGSHWWQSRSGQLEDEIVNEPAKVKDGKITGRFGSTQRRGFYGLFHERKQPFLRPAADREFPKLAERIAKKVD